MTTPDRSTAADDSAIDLLGVLSAKQMGAEKIIVMSRHATRQKIAREFGATDIVTDHHIEPFCE